jgi:hypothetical protein
MSDANDGTPPPVAAPRVAPTDGGSETSNANAVPPEAPQPPSQKAPSGAAPAGAPDTTRQDEKAKTLKSATRFDDLPSPSESTLPDLVSLPDVRDLRARLAERPALLVAFGRDNAEAVVLSLLRADEERVPMRRSGKPDSRETGKTNSGEAERDRPDDLATMEALADLMRDETRRAAPRVLVHVIDRSALGPYDRALLSEAEAVRKRLEALNLRLVLVVRHRARDRLDNLRKRNAPHVIEVPWFGPFLLENDNSDQIAEADRVALGEAFAKWVAKRPTAEPRLVAATRKLLIDVSQEDGKLGHDETILARADREWREALSSTVAAPRAAVEAFATGHQAKVLMALAVIFAPDRRVPVAALDDLVVELLGDATVPREHLPDDVIRARDIADRAGRPVPGHARDVTWADRHRERADVWRAEIGLLVEDNRVVLGWSWDAERAPDWVRANHPNAWRRAVERIHASGIFGPAADTGGRSGDRGGRGGRAGLLALELLLVHHADVADDDPTALGRLASAILGINQNGEFARTGPPNEVQFKRCLEVALESSWMSADGDGKARRGALVRVVREQLAVLVGDSLEPLLAGALVAIDRDADGGMEGIAEILRGMFAQASKETADNMIREMRSAVVGATPRDRARSLGMVGRIARVGAPDGRIAGVVRQLREDVLQNEIPGMLHRRPDADKLSLGAALFDPGAPERRDLAAAIAGVDGLGWYDPDTLVDPLRLAFRMTDVFTVCIGGLEVPEGLPLDALGRAYPDSLYQELHDAFLAWFVTGEQKSFADLLDAEGPPEDAAARIADAARLRREGRLDAWSVSKLDELQRSFLAWLDALERRFRAALLAEFRFAVLGARTGDAVTDRERTALWSGFDLVVEMGGPGAAEALRDGFLDLAEFVSRHAVPLAHAHGAFDAANHLVARASALDALAQCVQINN